MLTHSRAAVLGKPIAHSLSPVLHRAAYAATGLTGWTYDLRECAAGDLAGLLAGLGPTWRGLSLTMPLKEQALVEADVCSDVALQTGAVNTLIRQDRGWRGENTDVAGIRAALTAALAAARPAAPRADSAVVIGSGATARSALAALSALGVTQVAFVVRRQVRASTMSQARDHGLRTSTVADADTVEALLEAPLVVSTTPPGGSDAVAMQLAKAASSDGRRADGVLLDVVFAGWPTPLGSAAEGAGFTVVPGIEMLIHQAAEQFTLMTGVPAPLRAMQVAGRAVAAER